MPKAYPQTTFIGHADAFGANVSADYHNEAAYPSGPIVRGGITDKLLGDYPNLYGDVSANSGNNMLSRDPTFTADFLRRHQNKLLFGSDCGCTDGHGGGVSQGNNPGGGAVGRQVCRARDADSTETVLVGGDLQEDHVGECPHAAEDSGVAGTAGENIMRVGSSVIRASAGAVAFMACLPHVVESQQTPAGRVRAGAAIGDRQELGTIVRQNAGSTTPSSRAAARSCTS
jgi:hypothetical protein